MTDKNSNSNSTVIRKFDIKDKEAVRRISYDTAFMGQPSAIFFEGNDIFADALTLYFTDYEPESCFVAENKGEVIGYLIGAKDTLALNRIFLTQIAPRLLIKAFAEGALLKKKNIIFIFNFLRSLLKDEFKQADFSKNYPATLHINIDENFRKFGIGSNLIASYLDYLKESEIPGVHLATLSDEAGAFFSKQGFSLLHQSRRSYFRHVVHRDTPAYIYGKRLR